MFEELWENFINTITSRAFVIIVALVCVSAVLINRVFDLQIVHGEEYLDSFKMKIMRERTIKGSRGCIYDRNGNLLAYNELAHSVTIEDVYESGKLKNLNLNTTISRLIGMIERNGDTVVSDFKIILDKNGRYAYTVEGTQLYRFLADVYGHLTIDQLEEKEKTATAAEVVDYLCGWNRFRIGEYTQEDDKDSFIPGNGYTKEEALKILTVRYDMNNNSYQKYMPTTVATDICEETVAIVMENSVDLPGVSIEEDTIRRYVDSVYFSHILGYTGKVSQDELALLQEEHEEMAYDSNDTVGKLGIEKSMESWLQGTKGSETIFVDNVGKVTETTNYVEPVAGNNIYLTLDKDLQIAVYKILEQKLAGVLCSTIINAREFNTAESKSSNIKIPIYDVYFALINNNVIDTEHFSDPAAGASEKAVYTAFLERKVGVFDTLRAELTQTLTPYDQLDMEYQVYESYIAEMLYENGIIVRSRVDTSDETYIAWTKNEVISLKEFLSYCIARNWIDVTRLDMEDQYSDSEKIYARIVDYIFEQLREDLSFTKSIYRFMIKKDVISGSQICHILLEQGLVDISDEERDQFERGAVSSYNFIMERIRKLDITPAQLALDPYSASAVITDANTGDVLALVTYPGYDNNMMANGVNAEYYSKLLNDLSRPLNNYATTQLTAPGSTYKMVSATAGLMEGAITPHTIYTCNGIFEKIEPPPTCWIYSGRHGGLNVTGGLRHSCDVFFYELGYRLGTVGDTYSSDAGLGVLAKYADMYGLTELSGIEMEESAPIISTEDAVRSSIGQGSNAFSTVGIARYLTTVANSGTCFDLTLIDRITDHSGVLVENRSAQIRNIIEMDQENWDAIHQGMRQVIENRSDYRDLTIDVAGKTGTAEENANRGNHALFACYAPYENPEIAIVTRIAYGYTASYAAKTTKDILKYYYNLEDRDALITGEATPMTGGTVSGD